MTVQPKLHTTGRSKIEVVRDYAKDQGEGKWVWVDGMTDAFVQAIIKDTKSERSAKYAMSRWLNLNPMDFFQARTNLVPAGGPVCSIGREDPLDEQVEAYEQSLRWMRQRERGL